MKCLCERGHDSFGFSIAWRVEVKSDDGHIDAVVGAWEREVIQLAAPPSHREVCTRVRILEPESRHVSSISRQLTCS